MKGQRAGQLKGEGFLKSQIGGIKSVTGSKPVGLGEALSTDPTKQLIGNIAELPLMIATTRKITGKGKIDQKSVNRAYELMEHQYTGAIGRADYQIKDLQGLATKLNTIDVRNITDPLMRTAIQAARFIKASEAGALVNKPTIGFVSKDISKDKTFKISGQVGKVTGIKPPTFEESTQAIMNAIEKAKPLRIAQEAIYTAERGAKLTKGLATEKKLIPKEGYEKAFFAKVGSLKGAMSKLQFESVRKEIQPHVENLFKGVKETNLLNEWEKIPTGEGVQKILTGQIPTEGELRLLDRVFGLQLIQSILSKRPAL